jgi:hypothetical protein
MNKECQQYIDMLVDYASGLLPDSQIDTLKQHISGCLACREYLNALDKEEKSLAELFAEIDKTMQNRQEKTLQAIADYEPSGQKNISKWKMAVKYTAAAGLILAVSLFIFWPTSEPTIKTPPAVAIPPELAALTPEQLLQLYYNPSESTYDVNIIKVALQQSLEKTPSKKVIEIAKNFADPSGGGPSGGMGSGRGSAGGRTFQPYHPIEFLSYPNKAFADVVRDSNLFVYARLAHIDINVDDIIAALIQKEKFKKINFRSSQYRTTIQLDIIDALPRNSLKAGKSIFVPAVLNDNLLGNIKEGSDYYFAMVRNTGKDPNFLENLEGVYPANLNNPMMPQVWRFFADAQDILLSGNKPKQETLDYWIARLEGQNCELALEYMNLLPNELIPAGAVASAIQRRYPSLMVAQNSAQPLANDDLTKMSNLRILNRTANLLARAADKECIRQMFPCLDAYLFNEANMKLEVYHPYDSWWRKNRDGLRNSVVKLVIASAQDNPGKQLIETYFKYKKVFDSLGLITEIIDQAGKIADENMISMLLEMLARPLDFDLLDSSLTIPKIWGILASSDKCDMRSGLEKFLVSQNLSDAYVNLDLKNSGTAMKLSSNMSSANFEWAAFGILKTMPAERRPSHKELLDWLLLIYQRDKKDRTRQSFMASEMEQVLEPQDTQFVPIIMELFSKVDTYRLGKIICEKFPDPNFAPYVRAELDKHIARGSGYIQLFFKALCACGQEEEAINKALAILAKPPREDSASNLFLDISRDTDVISFLGQTKKDYLIPVIEGFAQQQYINKYAKVFEQFKGSGSFPFNDSLTLMNLQESANKAIANLRSK